MDGDSMSNSTEFSNFPFRKLEMGDSKHELLNSEKARKDFINNGCDKNRDVNPADEDIKKKIIQRAEKLFTDYNLWKDDFLLKHILKDECGYVSVQLIASFRKIKSLSKDWRVVAQCLLSSEKLRLSPDMTKVCRLSPLPNCLSSTTFTKVIVFDLPLGVKTHEGVIQLFTKFGKVKNAQVAGFANSTCPHKWTFLCKCMCSSIYAIVEFETSEEAKKAVKLISDMDESFTVAPIVQNGGDDEKPINKRRQNLVLWSKLLSLYSCNRLPFQSLERKAPVKQTFHQDEKKNHYDFRDQDEHKISTDLGKVTTQEVTAISTWMKKRQSFNKPEKKVVIIREPRGPDGTIGFHVGRAKAKLDTKMA